MRWLWKGLLGAMVFGALPGCSTPGDVEGVATAPSFLVVQGQQKLEAPDPGTGDRLGSSLAVSGGTALLGSPADDGSAGSVFVFVRTATGWTIQQKLVAVPRSQALFGSSVAAWQDVALIGAPRESVGVQAAQGAAYVLTRSGAHWTIAQRLAVEDPTRPAEQLGTAVALGDSLLVVGGRHSAWIYSRTGSTWVLEQVLGLPPGATEFGFSLALSGSTLLVGAREGANLGTAYVYVRQGAQWSLQQRLSAAPGQNAAAFGASVALSGNTALVGASESPEGGAQAPGAAHVFTRAGTVWTLEQVLSPSDLAAGDQFGAAVGLLGDVALVGAPFHDHAGGVVDQGAAYLFTRSAGLWSQEHELRGQDGNGHDYLGAVVALADDTALVAAPNDDGTRQAQGSAYAFTLLQAGSGTLGCVRVTPDGDDLTAEVTNGATPFASVQSAIDFANTHRSIATSVCVAAGPDCSVNHTYPGPAGVDLRMRSGISLVGRYESTGWTRCEDTHTALAPTTGPGVVFGSEVVEPTTLDGFSIIGSPAPTTAAVTLRGARGVELVDLEVPEQSWTAGAPRRSIGIQADAGSDLRIVGGNIVASPGTEASIGLALTGARVAADGLTLRASGLGRVVGVEVNGAPDAVFAQGSIEASGTTIGLPSDAAGLVATGNVQALQVENNEVTVLGSKVIGLSVDSELTTGVTITGNRVHATSYTDVTGIKLGGGGGPVVTANTVQCDGGLASGAVAVGIDCHARQVGGSLLGCTLVAKNVVHALSLSSIDRLSSIYQATGLFVDGVGTLVDANRVDAGCGAGRSDTRAIGIFARGDVRIQNNVAEGSRCPIQYGRSYGLWVDAASAGGSIDVHSNALLGGLSSGGNTIALELVGARAVIRNNILDPGVSNGAFNVDQASPAAAPSTLQNNDFVGSPGGLGLYRIIGAPDPTSIAEVNALPGAGDNFLAACSVPLAAGTACVDAGTTEGAPYGDIDGDQRLDGRPDVGPDELSDASPGPCSPVTVDTGARTVQSERFFLDFSNLNPTDPEELDVIRWVGQANMTQSAGQGACFDGDVEYFGNSWAPPDPQVGGRVLVGAGSTGTWQALGGSALLISSRSTACAPASAGVPVQTRYRFLDGIGKDTIEVERTFQFDSTPFNNSFRPYVPRLRSSDFSRVTHPNATGTTLLEGEPLDWDGSWFALSAPSGMFAGQGVIVRRSPSAFTANLWLDEDGFSASNASSALLLPPPGGFIGEVRERELLCFFDANSWPPSAQAALTLPPGCAFDLSCDGGSSGSGGSGGTGGSSASGGGGGSAGTGATTGGTSGAGGTSGTGTGGTATGGSGGSSGGATLACIHVSPDGDDASAAASSGALPFRTIQPAIDFAASHPSISSDVCLAAGPTCGLSASYDGPAGADLTIRDGVSVTGGFESSGWTRCGNSSTRIVPRSPRGVVFDGTTRAELAQVTVRNLDDGTFTPEAAVTLHGAKGVALTALTIESARGWGVDSSDGADVRLTGTTLAPQYDYDGDVVEGGAVRSTASRILIEASDILGSVVLDASPGSRIVDSALHAAGDAALRILNGAEDVEISRNTIGGANYSSPGWPPPVLAVGIELERCGHTEPRLTSNSIGTVSVGVRSGSDCFTQLAGNGIVGWTPGPSGDTGIGVDCVGPCTLTDNSVSVGSAAQLTRFNESTMSAIGVRCENCADIRGNQIRGFSNMASVLWFRRLTTRSIGLSVSGSGTLVSGNFIDGGIANGPAGGEAYGVVVDGDVRLENNEIHSGDAGESYPTPIPDYMLKQTSALRILGGEVDVNSNLLIGAQAGMIYLSAGIELAGPNEADIRNNITETLQSVPENFPRSLENNDVKPASANILFRVLGGPDALTVDELHSLPGLASSGNFSADCPQPLVAGAACVDAGTPVGAPYYDANGSRRRLPPDVGPTEAIDALHCTAGELVHTPTQAFCLCPPGIFGTQCQLSITRLSGVCGLVTDGSISCWGQGLSSVPAPAGPAYADVAMGKVTDHRCLLDTEGHVTCVGHEPFFPTVFPAAEQFQSIAVNYDHVCGIRLDGTVGCFGRDDNGQTSAPPGTFRQVSVGGWHSCGVRTDGTVACWGVHGTGVNGAIDYGQTTPPAGTFLEVDSVVGTTCGVRTDGSLTCWGKDLFAGQRPPTGTFKSVSVGDYFACGLRTDGTLGCWGELGSMRVTPTGTFQQLSTLGSSACALRDDGVLACWGPSYDAAPNGDFTGITNPCYAAPCDSHGTCALTVGLSCTCDAGYLHPTTDPFTCIENACWHDNGGCDPLTGCWGTELGGVCTACPTGYSGTGEAGCVP